MFLANARFQEEGESLKTAFDFKMLRNAFRELDVDNSGTLEIAELKQAFEKSGLSNEEMNDLFYKIDFNQDGKLNYTEFLAATVDKNKAVTQQNLKLAFHHFDVDNSGKITSENLLEVFKRQGQHMTKDECDKMINEANPENANELNFKEFETLIKNMADK